MRMTFVAVAVATVLLAVRAEGGFITEADTVGGIGQLQLSDELSFVGFDQSLGQLTGVRFLLSYHAEVTGLLTNTAEAESEYVLSLIGTPHLILPTAATKVPFDGIRRQRGLFGPGEVLAINMAMRRGLASASKIVVSSDDISVYRSPFTIRFDQPGFRFSGGEFTLESSRFGGTVTAEYEFTPAVPEPASIALMGLGGIGMFGGWYRKRRNRAGTDAAA